MTEESSRPLKVMQIIARMNIGGPAIYVTLIEEYLQQRGYDMQLITGNVDSDEGDMLYYAEEHGVTPTIIPELGRSLNPLLDLVTIWKLYRLIRQMKPDVVHTNTAKAGFVGRVAAWFARVPVVVHTFHGHVFHGYFSPLKTRLFILLEQITARMSDTIITITPRLRDELSNTYHIAPESHFTVQAYGLDLAPFAEKTRNAGDFRRAWQIPLDTPLIGIVARLVPIKNHMLFLDAVAQVHQQIPNAHFAIVGDGEMREQLESRVDELGLRDVITFTGWQKDVATICADLDVLVISSNNEGTPFTLIEAMATGCPVVSTNVGGIADLLKNGELGKMVPKGDAVALAEAIVSTLNNPPYSEATKSIALQAYGIERLVNDLDQLYRRLLAKK